MDKAEGRKTLLAKLYEELAALSVNGSACEIDPTLEAIRIGEADGGHSERNSGGEGRNFVTGPSPSRT